MQQGRCAMRVLVVLIAGTVERAAGFLSASYSQGRWRVLMMSLHDVQGDFRGVYEWVTARARRQLGTERPVAPPRVSTS